MNEDDKIIPSGPSKGKRIEMAPTSGVDMYQSIAEDFMKRIMGYEAGDFLISDESSLFDFEPFGEREVGELHKKIQEEYDLDVSDIESGNLLEIFRRIHRRQIGGGS